jgi:zeaxanthin glucosyltransferase
MSPESRRWHFGVLPFTGTGHLNPLIALSQELVRRGHRVTFCEKPKIEERVRRAGLEFVAMCGKKTLMSRPALGTEAGIRAEIATLRFNLERVIGDIRGYLEEAPKALASRGVNALLINEVALTGPTVAETLRLPYFLISTTVPHHFGWDGWSWITGHRSSTSYVSWLQSRLLELSALRVRGPVRHSLDAHRRNIGLGPIREIQKNYPCLAQITQMPQCLELPGIATEANFHYTGPWISSEARSEVEFPWERLDDRPLVYATLGTTRNFVPAILSLIAEACANLDLQLVITLGNRGEPEDFSHLPGAPIVTKFAPQLELLKRAHLVISHGGPNTAFETLAEGKPLVVIPLAYDQPAIAARLKRLHVAEVLPAKRLSVLKIRSALMKVLREPQYREAALVLQHQLRSTGGIKRAADIIAVEMEGYAARQQLGLRTNWARIGHREEPLSPAEASAALR